MRYANKQFFIKQFILFDMLGDKIVLKKKLRDIYLDKRSIFETKVNKWVMKVKVDS